MDIHVPKNLDMAFVLLTTNFDSALSLYLLCQKIHTNNLNVQLHVGICTSANSEAYSLNTARDFVYHISALFPNIINSHVRNVRYYAHDENNIEQVIQAHTNACYEWAVSFCSEFEAGTNIALYATDAFPIPESSIAAVEQAYSKNFDKIRLFKDRDRFNSVDFNGTAVPVIRPSIDNSVTREDIYRKIKELNLLELFNKTVSCHLSPIFEANHQYSQPCGECYGCLERDYLQANL